MMIPRGFRKDVNEILKKYVKNPNSRGMMVREICFLLKRIQATVLTEDRNPPNTSVIKIKSGQHNRPIVSSPGDDGTPGVSVMKTEKELRGMK